MKIKILYLCLLVSLGTSAQSLEGRPYFELSPGKALAFGPMTQSNSTFLKYTGAWSFNLGFTKYSSEGQLMNKDVIGYHFGYQFHSNTLDESDLLSITPVPNAYFVSKGNQLIHGPVFRLEYTRSGVFAPYAGIGAHLLAVRGSWFDLEFDAQQNYYQKASYKTSTWGTINPAFSVYGGIRVVMPGNWTIGLHYETYLRDAWSAKYTIIGTPATIDNTEVSRSFTLTEIGWLHHGELRVQFPLR
ncbi:MAG: hypothetical protein LPK45_01865 [Bacteroidota bacterium]|nr:hypothetical protein [Bacteroidota bacterium]MDX5429780.1 hypothetical protein [Bacteroidota bacterium]MDX5468559.1 hypothetical protein [Bacteroidota bacterium]